MRIAPHFAGTLSHVGVQVTNQNLGLIQKASKFAEQLPPSYLVDLSESTTVQGTYRLQIFAENSRSNPITHQLLNQTPEKVKKYIETVGTGLLNFLKATQ